MMSWNQYGSLMGILHLHMAVAVAKLVEWMGVCICILRSLWSELVGWGLYHQSHTRVVGPYGKIMLLYYRGWKGWIGLYRVLSLVENLLTFYHTSVFF